MTPSSYSTKTLLLLLQRKFVTFLRRNWLNILTSLALIFLLSQKNIQLELSWQAKNLKIFSTGLAQNTTDSLTKEKSLEQALSLGGISFSSKYSDDETSKSSKAKNPTFAQIHLGDYWSVVFRDRTPGKHQLDPSLVNQYQDYCQKYIKRFTPVAIDEMQKFGIPASIKLAQALLASNAGKAPLAQRFHNHFGIQCFAKNCKPGHCASHADLGHKSFYRKHESDWMSFRVHSQLLGSERYQSLKNFGTKDYEAWALGLAEAGYSADSHYAEKLIAIVQYFKLYHLDQ
jgi:flagellum-specific peptidoglycan hydrolase FlgJ